MLFTTLLFIFLFLPFTLLFYFIASPKFKAPILFLASLIFCAWGGFSYTSVLLGSIVVNYVSGILIGSAKEEKGRKNWFVVGIVANILLLVVFKYTNFLVDNVNVLTGLFMWDELVVNAIILPIGISFYTFKAISYLISVKRREVEVQSNIIQLGLYISLFPQLMAGPIDRYRTLAPQLANPSPTIELFASGIRRFTLGLAKKLIIANSLAYTTSEIFGQPLMQMEVSLAWFAAFLYMLQIYIDFSAYTDMAIGLGRMFGFRFMENFDFPYISRSVHEFWRRWHISLSFWLRDYLFLPIAYSTSRKLVKRRYFNIKSDYLIYLPAAMVTFIICGIWHGAAWSFLVWGLIHGLFLVFERIGLSRFLKRTYPVVRHGYLLLFLLLSWIFFRSATLEEAFTYIGVMAGLSEPSATSPGILQFLDLQLILALILGVGGSTKILDNSIRKLSQGFGAKRLVVRNVSFQMYEIGSVLFVVGILLLSVLFIVSETNRSFLYFQF
ncbi:MAG: MBOAT family protein [Bacteroidales bacterium]|nr:MBOAT family protein [Bacteroidales bacterium]